MPAINYVAKQVAKIATKTRWARDRVAWLELVEIELIATGLVGAEWIEDRGGGLSVRSLRRLRFRLQPAAAHCPAQDQRRADQGKIFNDVLAFQRQPIGKYGPGHLRQQEQW